MENQIPNITPNTDLPTDDLYNRGYMNGLLKVQQEHYKEYIQEKERSKQYTVEREILEQKIVEKKSAYAVWREKTLLFRNQIIDNEQIIETEQKSYKRVQADFATLGQAIDAGEKEKNSLIAPYSWIPAVLYLLAGIVFISSDISITHDIVSWGLDMGGIESWIFAVGLAALAFLIKPAIDRIVEKPYRTGQGIRTNHGVLVALCVVAMITLGILGYFRGEADKLKNTKRDLVSQKNKIQEQQSREPDQAVRLRMNKEIERIDQEIAAHQNALTNNWARVTSFILSSILFAFAGAVCLGIAFPALDILYKKQLVLPKLLRKKQAQLAEERQKLQASEQQIAQAQAQIQRAKVELELLPSAQDLTKELEDLDASYEQLLSDIYTSEIASQTAYYADGYEHGHSAELDRRISHSASELENKMLKNILATQNTVEKKTASEASRLRPYQLLRQHITDEFKRKNKE
ncbi:hypothetical protein SAMN05421780_10911 [Flexibacter flexilis DSM 6793]|uniref:Uncharacterized protein n=1 Tax=Flexibacter flexilis DSM 6793 TaxID=927664 RepID=A0A1I1LT85_9BACT|nr:hypothetical protein [Flexibacter flexilis]SFC73513.1 hypothetical protein SAMN05421780_10911 [Flexibacter flexilis DSM 6793]